MEIISKSKNKIKSRQTREKKIMKPQASSLKRSVRLLTDLITEGKERTHKLPI